MALLKSDTQSPAVGVLLLRLAHEEGDIWYPYNDATGKRVTCRPGGNLSIGIGINLENGLDADEREYLEQHRVNLLDSQLQTYAWYKALDPVRASVCLDIAYNEGLEGLLHFPHMIAALAAGDWKTAAAQCTVAKTNPALDASRYAPLRALLCGS